MRPALLFCLFVTVGYLANAQFTVTPQLGFENSKSAIQYNEGSSFSPTGSKLLPQAAIRFDYKSKQGHGLFLGMATSRSTVKFNFSDPQTGMNYYTASKGNTQLRLEGGYQVSTKPIYFKKSGSANKSSKINAQKSVERKGCGNYIARSSCGSKMSKATQAKPAGKGSWVRIQPSLGVAYIPFTPSSEIYTKSMGAQTAYGYNAGNWKTALISGVGFEFGNNEQRKFMFSINYLKGMSNLDTRSLTTTIPGNKSTTTTLKSDASSWALRMGIPISLNKKKPVVVKQQVIEKPYEKPYKHEYKCGQYKQCRKVI